MLDKNELKILNIPAYEFNKVCFSPSESCLLVTKYSELHTRIPICPECNESLISLFVSYHETGLSKHIVNEIEMATENAMESFCPPHVIDHRHPEETCMTDGQYQAKYTCKICGKNVVVNVVQ